MKSNEKFVGRASSGNHLVLEDCIGSFGHLIDIITKKKSKQAMKNDIRTSFSNYFKNDNFKELKKAQLDLAIHLEVESRRFNKQDLDNIQKIVLDALQKDKNDPLWDYLYENDSQVCRILVWKMKKVKVLDYNSASMTISFRVHAPSKQMIMISNRDETSRNYNFL